MPDQLSLRGGTTTEHTSFTGANKEVTVDTTKKTLVVHDGATAGGHPIMRENGGNSALSLGSAGTPALKFSGDTNTGIYSPGADQVSITTGGTERLRIDSNGQLEAVSLGSAAAPTYSFTTDPDTGLYSPGANQVALATNGVGRLFVASNGTVTTSQSIAPTGGLAAWNTGLNLFSPGGGVGQIAASADGAGTAGTLVFQTGSERLRIDSSGRVGIGTSTPAVSLDINNATGAYLRTGGATVALELGPQAGSNGPGIEYNVDGTTWIKGRSDAFSLAFRTNNLERLRITSTGQVRLAGAGITFNGDTATANELDDYEEGTWTPTVVGGTTAGTATYTTQSGVYTKVGRQVTVVAYLNWTGGTGTGNLFVSGLPFLALGGLGGYYYSASFGLVDGIALTANNVITGYVSQNTTTIGITQTPVGGGTYSTVAYDAAGHFMISCTYFA